MVSTSKYSSISNSPILYYLTYCLIYLLKPLGRVLLFARDSIPRNYSSNFYSGSPFIHTLLIEFALTVILFLAGNKH